MFYILVDTFENPEIVVDDVFSNTEEEAWKYFSDRWEVEADRFRMETV